MGIYLERMEIMFSKKDMSIGDWWLYWILMIIPFVNVVMFIVLLLSSSTNKTLKNMLLAAILPIILIIGLGVGFGLFATIADAI